MTEEEAKTKWCPFARLAASQDEWLSNRPTFAYVHSKGPDLCIASACMAWRWSLSPTAAAAAWEPADADGYCGLAGAP